MLARVTNYLGLTYKLLGGFLLCYFIVTFLAVMFTWGLWENIEEQIQHLM